MYGIHCGLLGLASTTGITRILELAVERRKKPKEERKEKEEYYGKTMVTLLRCF